MRPLYQLNNISFSYPLGKRVCHALNNLSLTIHQGERVGFSGPSGSGKSTLLHILGLIESVEKKEGSLQFNGIDLSTIQEREKNKIRLFDIGFIFQQFHLIPVLSAEENVEYFLVRQGLKQSERKERVQSALKSVGLWEFRNHLPDELSGGQRQRVAIARALAKNPRVIIADEPTANLDQNTSLELMNLLVDLNKKEGVTLIIASHDPMVIGKVDNHQILTDGSINHEEPCSFSLQ